MKCMLKKVEEKRTSRWMDLITRVMGALLEEEVDWGQIILTKVYVV